MRTTNFVNLNTTQYDQQFMKESMISRSVSVKPHITTNHIPRLQVKSSKIYKADYVSCTIRSQQDFDDLVNHINDTYGGYLIPVAQKINIEKHPEEAAQQYELYLNELLENKQIRDDTVLFKFFFVQEQQTPEKSTYQRFLQNAIELSRKHINQLFTRQDKDELIKYDKQLEEFRQIISQKKLKYLQLSHFITIKCEQYQNLNEILDILDINSQSQSMIYAQSGQLYAKKQILRIFKQIEGAYHRRLIVKERIKQLKADFIRHKYNSMHESTQKLLEKQRHKNQLWNQSMFKEIQFTLVIIDSLIRELIKNYDQLERLCYNQEERAQSVETSDPIKELSEL